MVYYLKTGEPIFVEPDSKVHIIRKLIEQQIGSDFATCFDDALQAYDESVADKCYDCITRATLHLDNMVDTLINHLDEFLKQPDAMTRNLQTIKKELNSLADDFAERWEAIGT